MTPLLECLSGDVQDKLGRASQYRGIGLPAMAHGGRVVWWAVGEEGLEPPIAHGGDGAVRATFRRSSPVGG
jgi:hypothetical protein